MPSDGHVTGLLRQQAAAAPDEDAIVAPDGRWSYARWSAEADRVAAALRADGVGEGDTVALIAPNGAAWLAVAFGTAAVGARLAPFNTWVKAAELDYLLSFSRPSVLVTVAALGRQDFLADLGGIVPEVLEGPGRSSPRLPSLRRVVVIGADAPPGATTYDSWLPAEAPADDLVAPADGIALVLFTSGSTARPKGVTMTHTDLVANGFQIGERQGLGPGDRLLLVSPLFWSLGSANALFATLTHRTTLVLSEQFRAGECLALIEAERVSAIYTLPVITEALLADPGFAPERVATLRRGLTFGPPWEVRRVVEDLGVAEISNIYGSTEVYGNCAVSPWSAPAARRIAASGPPLGGVEMRIVDPDSRATLATGEIGEIEARGRVSPGYLVDGGELAPVAGPGGWFATGDLGSLDDEGWVTFAGRRSEMIKTAGINVSPAEVEEVLLGHEAVAEVAVTGAPHPVRGEEVVAFVRLRPGAVAEPEELRAWASAQAASYKVPARLLVLEEMPTTPTGKLARKQLRAMASSTAGPDPTAPVGHDAR